MSKSIIEDLYYCRRGNPEKIKVSKTYWDIVHKITSKENILFKNFNKKQHDMAGQIEHLQGCLQSEVGLASFKEGLKIGIRLGIECMTEKKED